MADIFYMNPDEIRKAIETIKPDNQLFECRVLQGRKTWSGYFASAEQLIKQMAALQRQDMLNAQFYITANRLKEHCYARQQRDKLLFGVSATKKPDIEGYQYLFIDFDPDRDSGISATDEELRYAIDMCDEVEQYLTSCGWPVPIRALSGNGHHLLYPVNIPYTDDNETLIKKCMQVLDGLFSTSQCHVDTGNFNPDRICKLPGSLAQKGANTPERPHRMSRIIHAGDGNLVSMEQLQALAAELPEPEPKPTKGKKTPTKAKSGNHDFDVCSWMDEHGINYTSEENNTWGTIHRLDSCPFCGNGDGARVFNMDGRLGFRCWHNSCQGIHWKEFRLHFEPDAYDRKPSVVTAADALVDDIPTEDTSELPNLTYVNSRGQECLLTYGVYRLIKATNRLVFILGEPYIFRNGFYQRDVGGALLKSKILQTIPKDIFRTAANVDSIYRLFVMDAELQKAADEMNQFPAHWACFRNGLWDCIGKAMHPHSPDYFCLNQIPHEYHPDESPLGENIDKFLNHAIPDATDREMLLQYCGYSFTRDTRQQKMLLLDGRGGTGKSSVLTLQGAALGHDNIAAVSLDKLCSNRFAAFNLIGKLGNICADLKIKSLEDVAVIKQALGEDLLEGERKGGASEFFQSTAKMFFSVNGLPQVLDDKSNAFYRRLLILRMNQLPVGEPDIHLQEKLQSEMPHWIHLCMAALARMYEAGHITESNGSTEAVVEMQYNSDTVTAFLTDCTTDAKTLAEVAAVEDNKTTRNELLKAAEGTEQPALYGFYQLYCLKAERQALGKKGFFQQLRNKGIAPVKGKTTRIYKTLKVKPVFVLDGVCYTFYKFNGELCVCESVPCRDGRNGKDDKSCAWFCSGKCDFC